jgi:hypothetical protein
MMRAAFLNNGGYPSTVRNPAARLPSNLNALLEDPAGR